MPRVSKDRRLRRKARLQRKRTREENTEDREDRRREEAEGWAELIRSIESQYIDSDF